MSFPIQKKLLNDTIPDSRYRAKLLSMESIMDRAVCAVVAVALGTYLAGERLTEFLVLSSVVTVILTALQAGLLIRRQDHKAATSSARPVMPSLR